MKLYILAILSTMVIFLQGCEFISPYLEVIQPPKLTKEQTNLIADIYEQLPIDATLIQTSTFRYSSKYHFFDLNSDGSDELIVFYYEKEREYLLHLGIFKKVDEHYVLKQKIQTSYTYLHEVNFVDLNGDDFVEILLSFPENDEIKDNKRMLIYEVQPEKGYSLVTEKDYYSYSTYNNPSTNETQLIFVESNEQHTIVSLTKFIDTSIKLIDSITLPFGRDSIIQVTHGQFSPNTYGISIDEREKDKSLFPNLVLISGDELEHVPNQKIKNQPFNFALTSDFDLDDILEISIILQSGTRFTEELHYPLQLLLQWYERDNEGNYKVEKTIYYDLIDKYIVKLPDEYNSNVYFKEKGNSFQIFEKGTDKLLFHILKISKYDTESTQYQTILGERGNYKYVSPMYSSTLKGQFYFMTDF